MANEAHRAARQVYERALAHEQRVSGRGSYFSLPYSRRVINAAQVASLKAWSAMRAARTPNGR